MRSVKTNLAVGLVVFATALFGIARVHAAALDCCGSPMSGGDCVLEHPLRACGELPYLCENPNFMTCCPTGGFCSDIGGR